MKKLVISLLRRPDRKVSWQSNKLNDFEYIEAIDGSNTIFRDIKARKDWTDPFKKRPLLQNEVACFLSHIKAWKRCIELNKTVIVMEDDAVINSEWNEKEFEAYSEIYDFIYLQRNENEPDGVDRIDDYVEYPCYPYNMTAYVITPEMAKDLVDAVDYQDFIPVDEFMPEYKKTYRSPKMIVALVNDACNQLSRNDYGSDIEISKPFRPYKIHAVTCGTDRKKCIKINTSARINGIDLINIGNNIDWKGTDMSGPGGGMKINLMKEYIKDLPDNDIILFTDAYDVFYADDLDTIVERYEHMDSAIVFSAETICWPDRSLSSRFPKTTTRYRYINSGTYIGSVKELRKLFNDHTIKDNEDDQLYVHKCYLDGKYDIKLDEECYIFQTHSEKVIKLGNQLNNLETNCCPCIYHGNGGKEAEQKFNQLYNEFYPTKSSMFIPNNGKYEVLAKDMLLVDFMTQEQCERLIDLADKHGGWGSLEYDKFPAQEIRLKELDLWEELNTYWAENVVPIVEKYWKPLLMYGLRDGFVMRYALDTQINLNLHHDASLVTGSVKLNDDYEGAELIYPRQNITNEDIPIGKMILFPGAVTHGHECLPLRSGTKYSLTIWSCRFPNDTI